jgi:hypothetical protein
MKRKPFTEVLAPLAGKRVIVKLHGPSFSTDGYYGGGPDILYGPLRDIGEDYLQVDCDEPTFLPFTAVAWIRPEKPE